MKLSDWAKKQGISYTTAYRWFKDNKLPVKSWQAPSGTIIIEEDTSNVNKEDEDKQDLMKDLVAIITSFCCRLYGLRRGKNKAKKVATELVNEKS